MALIYQPSKRIFCGWFEPLKSTTYSEYPLQRIQAGLPALRRLGCARRRADHGPWHVERRLADKPHRTPCAGRLSGHHARQPRLRGELPLHGHEGGRKKRGLSRGAGASAPKGDERLRA